MRKIELEKIHTRYGGVGYIVNNKYEVWKSDGLCFNMITGGDLPQYVFKFRDELLSNNIKSFIIKEVK